MGRLTGLGAAVWRDVVVSRIREGRLRAAGWPYGLRWLVTLLLILFGLAAVLVLAGPLLRRSVPLLATSTMVSGLPADWFWALIFLIAVLAALVHTACLHGAWWLKIIGLLITTVAMVGWGLGGTFTGDLNAGQLTVLGCAVAMIVFSVLRWRGRFRWWEFPVVLGLIGTLVLTTLVANRYAQSFGFEFAPAMVQQSLATIGFLATPAAMVAGVAVAEIAINLTIVVTGRVQRLAAPLTGQPHRRAWGALPYLILVGLLLIRLGQSVLELRDLDPVAQGLPAVVLAVLVVAAVGGLGWLTLRLARGRGEIAVGDLPDELSAVGLPISAALAGLLLPILVVSAVISALVALNPLGMAGQARADAMPLADLTDGVRLAVAVACVGIGLLLARRGRPTRGLLLCCVAVMIFGQLSQLLTGYRLAVPFDLTMINLVATGVTVLLIVLVAARRRLTPVRALALSGLLVLSALVSARDVITDPVEVIFGYSGAPIVLFGLVWTFLTGSGWGNGHSSRFPRPTRVLLIMANLLLATTLLAYLALVGTLTNVVDLDDFADLGDVLFGTGLLAAAYVAVVSVLRAGRPIAE
ncbi:hypothetical protein [Microlunatus sp. GCM10028923]|uniref:hypothetical protein n=1 Tax=Microlunatus sp. GCM10028923 TaxID=3273400 RepID=UPI00360ED7E2